MSLKHDFCKDDFFRAMLDFVHSAYPTKLIPGFQFLCDALLFCHLRDHGFQPFLAGAINFCQVLLQFPDRIRRLYSPG